MSTPQINRRRALQAFGATAAIPLLGSCSGDDSPGPADPPGSTGATTSSSAPSASVLPTYTPREIVPADMPATESGVPAAYFDYPAELVQAHDEPPASGETFETMHVLATTPPPPLDSNPYWQELNKRLGATLNITFVPGPDYGQKTATVLAGDEIPDFMSLLTATPQVDKLLDARFQDLSQWLNGDAISAYPNLAALPTASWKNMVFNGGIYGVPYSVPVGRPFPMVRQDLLDDLGYGSVDLSDGQGFVELCEALTDPQNQRWAFGAISNAQSMARIMADVPNIWRVENGKFTTAYETDEYKKSLEILRDLWKREVFHPDGAALTYGENRTMLIGGRVALSFAGYVALPVWMAEGKQQKDDFNLRGMVLPKWDGGGQGTYPEETGQGGRFTVVRKMETERVETILRILDWIATPFGSTEYEMVMYGMEGRHFTRDGNNPVVTEQGTAEVQAMSISDFGRSFIPIYVAGDQETTEAEYNTMKDLLTVSEPHPTVGLQSETDLKSGASIKTNIDALELDIILDRKNLNDWDAGVEEWKAAGGDQIAREYEESYAAVNG